MLRTVLGIICVTAKNQPLSMAALHEFIPQVGGQMDLPREGLEAIIRDLRSVLYEDKSKGCIIRVCHPSFLDFLENHVRCSDFWMDPEQLHQALAERCFTIMRTTLRFNMCGLETSYLANVDVDDLEQKVKDGISEPLQYSCLYWVTHLTAVNRAASSRHLLDFFQSLLVLYWLEVLSLIGGLKKGLSALQDVSNLYEVRTDQPLSSLF